MISYSDRQSTIVLVIIHRCCLRMLQLQLSRKRMSARVSLQQNYSFSLLSALFYAFGTELNDSRILKMIRFVFVIIVIYSNSIDIA